MCGLCGRQTATSACAALDRERNYMADHVVTNDPWMDYALNESPPWWSFQDMDRSRSRAEYRRVMAVKSERIDELNKLVARFGPRLDNTDESVQILNDWFMDAMAPLGEKNIPNGRFSIGLRRRRTLSRRSHGSSPSGTAPGLLHLGEEERVFSVARDHGISSRGSEVAF